PARAGSENVAIGGNSRWSWSGGASRPARTRRGGPCALARSGRGRPYGVARAGRGGAAAVPGALAVRDAGRRALAARNVTVPNAAVGTTGVGVADIAGVVRARRTAAAGPPGRPGPGHFHLGVVDDAAYGRARFPHPHRHLEHVERVDDGGRDALGHGFEQVEGARFDDFLDDV